MSSRRARAAAAAVLFIPVASGCSALKSYPEMNGQLAVGRDGEHTVVHLHTCRGAVEQLDISGDRQGLAPSEQNKVLGELRAKSPVSGDVVVDLAAPGPTWEVVTPITLPTSPGQGIIVTARHESASTEMRQTAAYIGDIRALKTGEVIVDLNRDPGGTTSTSTSADTPAASDHQTPAPRTERPATGGLPAADATLTLQMEPLGQTVTLAQFRASACG